MWFPFHRTRQIFRSASIERLGRATSTSSIMLSLLLLLGLTGWWLTGWWLPGDSRSVLTKEQTQSRAPVGALQSASEITRQAGIPALEAGGARQQIAAEPNASPAALAQQQPNGLLWLRVLQAPQKRPVEGAEVRLLHRKAPAKRPGRAWANRAIHQDTTLVTRAVTDAAGMASIAWPPGEAPASPVAAEAPSAESPDTFVLEASLAGAWGFLWVSEEEQAEPHELLLWPDRTVHVRAINAWDGKPAAQREIRLSYFYGDGPPTEVNDLETTDSEGRATFRHVTQHMDLFWPHTEFFAIEPVDFLGQGFRPARIDPDALEQEVLLKLPPTIDLTVQVVGVDGNPYQGKGLVAIQLRDPDAEDPAEDFEDATEGLEATLHEGKVRFADVEAGLPIWVSLRDESITGGSPLAHTVIAPPSGQESVTLRLESPPRHILLRLENPEGELLRTGRASLNGQKLSPPPQGEDVWRCGPRNLRLNQGQANSALVEWEQEPLHLSARVNLPPLDSSRIDLGTLRLSTTGRLAAGRVIQADGSPAEDARITLYLVNGERRTHVESMRTDASGEFGFFGSTELRSGVLHVSHRDTPNLTVPEFSVGKADIELRLQSAGILEGNLIMDPLWQRDFLDAQAVFESGPTKPHAGLATEIEIDECGFMRVALLPGRYRVDFRMEADPEPLLTLTGFDVRAGESNRDPRLQDLHLEGRARLITLRPVDPTGESLEDAWARLLGGSGHAWGDEVSMDGRALHIFSMHHNPELLVGAEGFRTRLVIAPADGDRVELLPADQIALVWKGDWPQGPSGAQVYYRHFAQAVGWPDQQVHLSMTADPEDPEWSSWPGGDRLRTVVMLSQKTPSGSRRRTELGEFVIPIHFQGQSLIVPMELPESLQIELQQLREAAPR